MRKVLVLLALCSACGGSARQAPSTQLTQQPAASPSGPPPWAYGFAAPATAAPANSPGGGARPPGGGGGAGGGGGQQDTTKHTAMGSSLSFTLQQVRNTFGPADWFPGDHGEMPPIVASGKRDANVLACSLCHYPNGKGRPENAGVSGLPVSYFIQTMQDFKNDKRRSSDTRKANTNRMIAFAKAMTDEEVRAAAEYFAAIKWTSWIKVIEADVVPKTRIAQGMFIPVEGAEAGTEPIGRRIIEVPENTHQTEVLRNPRSGFIAYVPRGSLSRGESVASKSQCALCHGADLKGLGPVPGIAGRSPSYMVRQLYDMQSGARKGEWAELMKHTVAPLSADEMIAVAAYAASRTP